jgi:hypothetical protein
MNCVYFNAKKREKKFHLKKEKYLPPKCRGKNENAATTKKKGQRNVSSLKQTILTKNKFLPKKAGKYFCK